MVLDGAMALSWTVVVPIKGFAQAKSRFGDETHRGTLASAFVTDVVAALLAAPRVAKVIVVTSDIEAVNIAHLLGAQSTADELAVPRLCPSKPDCRLIIPRTRWSWMEPWP